MIIKKFLNKLKKKKFYYILNADGTTYEGYKPFLNLKLGEKAVPSLRIEDPKYDGIFHVVAGSPWRANKFIKRDGWIILQVKPAGIVSEENKVIRCQGVKIVKILAPKEALNMAPLLSNIKWNGDKDIFSHIGLARELRLMGYSPELCAEALYLSDGANLCIDQVAQALHSDEGAAIKPERTAKALKHLGLTAEQIARSLFSYDGAYLPIKDVFKALTYSRIPEEPCFNRDEALSAIASPRGAFYPYLVDLL